MPEHRNSGVSRHADLTLGSVFEIVSEESNGRIVLRFTEGALAGRCVTAFTDEECALPYRPPLTPREKAERLLTSLLDPAQRAQWRTNKRFGLETPYGVLELGVLHNMAFRPTGPHWSEHPCGPIHLCVVPRGELKRLPSADIWTNLLLVVRAEPERFFSVANWRIGNNYTWYRPPIRGIQLRGRTAIGA
jgi:hypothetical protein